MPGVVDPTGVIHDSLLPRQNGCVVCQSGTPVCPTCASNEECQFTVPLDCTQCPRAYCAVSSPTPTPTASKSSGPSTGAIAGAVVGGVALIAGVGIITYLVWRFCIKNKRQQLEQEPWDEDQETPSTEAEKVFAQRRSQRASTHTVHSIASTVLTRASNIIQIAYIPGVTNRATPTSPTLLVPPVPPIPIAISQANSPAATEDQHFFVPGDLRDSTYSGISGYSDRTSYARTSYAPRSSIASTIYGKNAVILTPAQTGMRAKAAMVSVRSTGSGNSATGGLTPPVPAVDYDKYNNMAPPSPAASTFSVGSTFLNNATVHTATATRAQVVRVGSGPKKGSPDSPASVPEEDVLPQMSSPTVRDSNAVTLIDDSPVPDQGPFSDPPENRKSTTSLSAVIEEATRRASQRTSALNKTERERSPFGDEHATHDD